MACVCCAGEPSYANLVDSFRSVCEAAETSGDKVLDVEQLVHEPGALKEALAISKDSVIEWMEVQEGLLDKKPDFMFRVKEATKVP
jgi:hypothetical protein